MIAMRGSGGKRTWALLAASLAMSVPIAAQAKVASVSDKGFTVQLVTEVPAPVGEAWQMLLRPAQWWDSDHTFSGDAANMSIDPRAGGCFCEILPNRESPRAAPRGSVEHMRVIYLEEPRVLRMVGALGPLQGDAVAGTLTVNLKAEGANGKGGTAILLEYTVGGNLRTPVEKMSEAVNAVLGAQLARLAAKLGNAEPIEVPAAKAEAGADDADSGNSLATIPTERFPLDGEGTTQPDDDSAPLGNPNLPEGR